MYLTPLVTSSGRWCAKVLELLDSNFGKSLIERLAQHNNHVFYLVVIGYILVGQESPSGLVYSPITTKIMKLYFLHAAVIIEDISRDTEMFAPSCGFKPLRKEQKCLGFQFV